MTKQHESPTGFDQALNPWTIKGSLARLCEESVSEDQFKAKRKEADALPL